MQSAIYVVGLLFTIAAAFGLGYWFGYRCGQQDAEAGVREP